MGDRPSLVAAGNEPERSALMTPEDWQRAKPILAAALELDSAGRASFLKEACAAPLFERKSNPSSLRMNRPTQAP